MSQPGIIFRAFDRCTGFFTDLSPLFDLAIRLWVAQVFFMSGLTKIRSWSGTLALFEYEYQVPLLPPAVAALLGTAAELTLPILIAIGLATRLSSLALPCSTSSPSMPTVASCSPTTAPRGCSNISYGAPSWRCSSSTVRANCRWIT